MGDSDGDTGELETMRTTCPTCDTAYTVPDERIGAKGRKVRCTKCGDEWRVMLVAEEIAPPPPPRPAPRPEPAPSAAAVDPFDAIDAEGAPQSDIDAGFGADPGGTGHEAAEETMPEAATAEPPASEAALPTAATALPPGRRVHIRTRRRFPSLRGKAIATALARSAPFAGPAVFLAACLTVTSVYVFRQALVAAAPDLAGLYSALGAPVNLRGLAFGRIETLREIDNGQPVLVVEGSITNVTQQMREVPALRFALRGQDTQELYAWSIDPKSTTIEAGDTVRFRSRLAAPPDLATEVQVRFVERRSQHAGLP